MFPAQPLLASPPPHNYILNVMPTRLVISLIVATSLGSAQAEKLKLPEGERLPTPVLQPASGEAEIALQTIDAPYDLELSVFAAEPLMANTVAFTFDEQGRAYLSETHRTASSVIDMRWYPTAVETDLASRTVEDRAKMIEDLFENPEQFAIESELVRIVEDTNGDGVADSSSIYADGFNSSVDGIASGVLVRKGKVWFTNIPSLWQLEGKDDDGKAVDRKQLLTGFGVHFGYYGHDLHGLTWGPDGKLYFSVGDRGANVVNQEGERIEVIDTGAVFRCNPDGSDFEVFAFGLRNPQEIIFDEFGNLFTGDNDCDNGDMERLVHVVEGGDSGWRVGHQYAPLGRAGMWMLEDLWKTRHEGQAAYIIPPVCLIEDGPSGVAYYPGTGLSPRYKGHIFICHFKGSLANSGVHTYKVKNKGATFEIESSEAFARKLLPTDVAFGPDGRLYISDWVSGWRKTGKGRLFAVSHPETAESDLVKETQRLISEGMEDRSNDELASLLAHADQRVRLEAQFELAERGSSSIEILSTTALDTSVPLLGRIHAAWGLGQLGSESAAQETIVKLLSDEADEVRAQAAKLAGDHRIRAAYKTLIAHLEDSNARVQFFAAQSLGKFNRKNAAPALIELLRRNDDEDNYLRHAAVMGLVGSKNLGTLKKTITDESRAVRLGALLAMRRLEHPSIARFLEDEDDFLVLEAARAINDEDIKDALPVLAAKLDSPIGKENKVFGLRAINAHFRLGGETNAQALASYSKNDDALEELRVEALRQLGEWPDPLDRDRIVGIYRPLRDRSATPAKEALQPIVEPLLASAPGPVQGEVISSIGELGLTDSADALFDIVSDLERSTEARVASLETLDKINDPRIEELVKVAGQSDDAQLRLATLPILARLSPDEAAPILKNLAENGDAAEQQAAYIALSNMISDESDQIIASSIDRLIDNQIPIEAQLELLETAEGNDSEVVKAALAKRHEAIAANSDPIAGWEFALEGGTRRPGQKVFFTHSGMACVRCHKIGGEGGTAGPDLTGIAKDRDRRELLEAIVAPSATLAPGYEMVIATMKSGKTVTGILTEDTDTTMSLELPDGFEITLSKSDIAQKTSAPSSMPPVFTNMLSKTELRDLVEYLATLDWDEALGPSRATTSGH